MLRASDEVTIPHVVFFVLFLSDRVFASQQNPWWKKLHFPQFPCTQVAPKLKRRFCNKFKNVIYTRNHHILSVLICLVSFLNFVPLRHCLTASNLKFKYLFGSNQNVKLLMEDLLRKLFYRKSCKIVVWGINMQILQIIFLNYISHIT